MCAAGFAGGGSAGEGGTGEFGLDPAAVAAVAGLCSPGPVAAAPPQPRQHDRVCTTWGSTVIINICASLPGFGIPASQTKQKKKFSFKASSLCGLSGRGKFRCKVRSRLGFAASSRRAFAVVRGSGFASVFVFFFSSSLFFSAGSLSNPGWETFPPNPVALRAGGGIRVGLAPAAGADS